MVQKGASIGSSATLLCGVMVGQNAIVGAASMVTKNVPANTIVAGNPARFLKKVEMVNLKWPQRIKENFKKYLDLSLWTFFKRNGKTKI
jgi:serine acetyltransferase